MTVTVPTAGHGRGLVGDLWKLLDIEHRGALHRVLDLSPVVCRDPRVQHAHLARVHAQLNTWSGGRIDPILVTWCFYFEIVLIRGKLTRLDDSHLQNLA